MFLINKGGCCKPPVHSHRLSLQPFLCCLPALPGVSGKKKLVCISHTDREAVGDGATFYKSDFKGAACLAPQGWSGRWNGAQTLKMTANLHWIWSARHVDEKNYNKGFKSKTRRGGGNQQTAYATEEESHLAADAARETHRRAESASKDWWGKTLSHETSEEELWSPFKV